MNEENNEDEYRKGKALGKEANLHCREDLKKGTLKESKIHITGYGFNGAKEKSLVYDEFENITNVSEENNCNEEIIIDDLVCVGEYHFSEDSKKTHVLRNGQELRRDEIQSANMVLGDRSDCSTQEIECQRSIAIPSGNEDENSLTCENVNIGKMEQVKNLEQSSENRIDTLDNPSRTLCEKKKYRLTDFQNLIVVMDPKAHSEVHQSAQECGKDIDKEQQVLNIESKEEQPIKKLSGEKQIVELPLSIQARLEALQNVLKSFNLTKPWITSDMQKEAQAELVHLQAIFDGTDSNWMDCTKITSLVARMRAAKKEFMAQRNKKRDIDMKQEKKFKEKEGNRQGNIEITKDLEKNLNSDPVVIEKAATSLPQSLGSPTPKALVKALQAGNQFEVLSTSFPSNTVQTVMKNKDSSEGLVRMVSSSVPEKVSSSPVGEGLHASFGETLRRSDDVCRSSLENNSKDMAPEEGKPVKSLNNISKITIDNTSKMEDRVVMDKEDKIEVISQQKKMESNQVHMIKESEFNVQQITPTATMCTSEMEVLSKSITKTTPATSKENIVATLNSEPVLSEMTNTTTTSDPDIPLDKAGTTENTDISKLSITTTTPKSTIAKSKQSNSIPSTIISKHDTTPKQTAMLSEISVLKSPPSNTGPPTISRTIPATAKSTVTIVTCISELKTTTVTPTFTQTTAPVAIASGTNVTIPSPNKPTSNPNRIIGILEPVTISTTTRSDVSKARTATPKPGNLLCKTNSIQTIPEPTSVTDTYKPKISTTTAELAPVITSKLVTNTTITEPATPELSAKTSALNSKISTLPISKPNTTAAASKPASSFVESTASNSVATTTKSKPDTNTLKLSNSKTEEKLLTSTIISSAVTPSILKITTQSCISNVVPAPCILNKPMQGTSITTIETTTNTTTDLPRVHTTTEPSVNKNVGAPIMVKIKTVKVCTTPTKSSPTKPDPSPTKTNVGQALSFPEALTTSQPITTFRHSITTSEVDQVPSTAGVPQSEGVPFAQQMVVPATCKPVAMTSTPMLNHTPVTIPLVGKTTSKVYTIPSSQVSSISSVHKFSEEPTTTSTLCVSQVSITKTGTSSKKSSSTTTVNSPNKLKTTSLLAYTPQCESAEKMANLAAKTSHISMTPSSDTTNLSTALEPNSSHFPTVSSMPTITVTTSTSFSKSLSPTTTTAIVKPVATNTTATELLPAITALTKPLQPVTTMTQSLTAKPIAALSKTDKPIPIVKPLPPSSKFIPTTSTTVKSLPTKETALIKILSVTYTASTTVQPTVNITKPLSVTTTTPARPLLADISTSKSLSKTKTKKFSSKATSAKAPLLPTPTTTDKTPLIPTPTTTAKAPLLPTPATTAKAPLLPTPATTAKAPLIPTPTTTTAKAPLIPTPTTTAKVPLIPTPTTTAKAPLIPTPTTTTAKAPLIPTPTTTAKVPLIPTPTTTAKAPLIPTPTTTAKAPLIPTPPTTTTAKPLPRPPVTVSATPLPRSSTTTAKPAQTPATTTVAKQSTPATITTAIPLPTPVTTSTKCLPSRTTTTTTTAKALLTTTVPTSKFLTAAPATNTTTRQLSRPPTTTTAKPPPRPPTTTTAKPPPRPPTTTTAKPSPRPPVSVSATLLPRSSTTTAKPAQTQATTTAAKQSTPTTTTAAKQSTPATITTAIPLPTSVTTSTKCLPSRTTTTTTTTKALPTTAISTSKFLTAAPATNTTPQPPAVSTVTSLTMKPKQNTMEHLTPATCTTLTTASNTSVVHKEIPSTKSEKEPKNDEGNEKEECEETTNCILKNVSQSSSTQENRNDNSVELTDDGFRTPIQMAFTPKSKKIVIKFHSFNTEAQKKSNEEIEQKELEQQDNIVEKSKEGSTKDKKCGAEKLSYGKENTQTSRSTSAVSVKQDSTRISNKSKSITSKVANNRNLEPSEPPYKKLCLEKITPPQPQKMPTTNKHKVKDTKDGGNKRKKSKPNKVSSDSERERENKKVWVVRVLEQLHKLKEFLGPYSGQVGVILAHISRSYQSAHTRVIHSFDSKEKWGPLLQPEVQRLLELALRRLSTWLLSGRIPQEQMQSTRQAIREGYELLQCVQEICREMYCINLDIPALSKALLGKDTLYMKNVIDLIFQYHGKERKSPDVIKGIIIDICSEQLKISSLSPSKCSSKPSIQNSSIQDLEYGSLNTEIDVSTEKSSTKSSEIQLPSKSASKELQPQKASASMAKTDKKQDQPQKTVVSQSNVDQEMEQTQNSPANLQILLSLLPSPQGSPQTTPKKNISSLESNQSNVSIRKDLTSSTSQIPSSRSPMPCKNNVEVEFCRDSLRREKSVAMASENVIECEVLSDDNEPEILSPHSLPQNKSVETNKRSESPEVEMVYSTFNENVRNEPCITESIPLGEDLHTSKELQAVSTHPSTSQRSTQLSLSSVSVTSVCANSDLPHQGSSPSPTPITVLEDGEDVDTLAVEDVVTLLQNFDELNNTEQECIQEYILKLRNTNPEFLEEVKKAIEED
ncbi:uncharacterized protein LOC143024715 isoform X2 [Oratosquilla oratoria]